MEYKPKFSSNSTFHYPSFSKEEKKRNEINTNNSNSKKKKPFQQGGLNHSSLAHIILLLLATEWQKQPWELNIILFSPPKLPVNYANGLCYYHTLLHSASSTWHQLTLHSSKIQRFQLPIPISLVVSPTLCSSIRLGFQWL